MASRKQYQSSMAFLDLLFNMLLAFVAFFFLTLILVNPKVKNEKNVEAKAEVIITVTWDKNCPDDVDTYVEDPTGRIVYFQRKEDGLMHLDRDDLGWANDKIVTPSGTFEYNENREIVTLRGLIPGEYCVNVHMYSKREIGDTKVRIIAEKINPSLRLYAAEEVTLFENGDERTAFRFTVTAKGDIINVNKLQKEIATPKVGNRSDQPNPGDDLSIPNSPLYNEEPEGE
jgi:hypothetical protein